MTGNWLIDLLCEAKTKNWCNKLWCTTCGAWDFRSEFARRAAIQINLPPGFSLRSSDPLGRPPLLQNLPPDLLDQAIDESARALSRICIADLNASCGQHYAEYSIGMILYEIGVCPGQPVIFQSLNALQIIEGSDVGAYAREWEAAAHARAQKEWERKEFQSPGETAKRQEKRRASRAETAQKRSDDKQARERKRAEFLQKFALLAPQEKLLCLAHGAEGWPADIFPEEYIREISSECDTLSHQQKESLIKYIGKRGGIWRDIKECLADRPKCG